tara:strand:+ start:22 stop:126 length:105 start_codon:yes stop_codon:yes gene_type:complete
LNKKASPKKSVEKEKPMPINKAWEVETPDVDEKR